VSACRLPAAVAPNIVVVLNNLAWAAGQAGGPDAVRYAERAVKLAPDSAPVLGTLGSLLVARGEHQRGVDQLARAARLAPDRSDIRLDYAKALLGAGRKDDARCELQLLASLPREFAGKADIPKLLASL
jgi:Flp pilus assembly protein TadD